MEILKYSLGQLQANCYFLLSGNNCLIIDPADEARFILEELQRRKLKLVEMLATHGHFDHVMAAGEIQLSSNVFFYINKKDLFLIERLEETAKYFLGYDPHVIKPNKINYLKEGKLEINEFSELRVLLMPGHTPGSCCFYFAKEKIIFTGDTLFKQAVGRYDFSYSNKNELKKSIQKLFKLPKDTIAYPGHGEKTKINEEKTSILMF